MSTSSRRSFLQASSVAALSSAIPADLFAQAGNSSPVKTSAWERGALRHLLPTVSDTRMLIKASFNGPLHAEPRLRVGDMTVTGRMTDTRG